MRHLPFAALSVSVVLSLGSIGSLRALTSDRSGHLFTQDEEYIVLNTTLANGTNATWTLTNLLYNNETITGTSVVHNGQVRIPTRGLLASEYTFTVSGDGSINGGLLPPLFDYHPELTPFVLCQFNDNSIVSNCRIAWDNSFERSREPYMWRQLGMREVRVEFRFDQVNPSAGTFTWDPNREEYFAVCRDNFIRPTIKIVGSQNWNGGIRNYPTNMVNWRSGLQGIAQRYFPLGVDKYYMVGRADEQSWWWDTTQSNADAKYVDFVNNTNDVLKAVNPSIIFVAPENWAYDVAFTDLVLSSASFDIFSADFPCDTMDAYYAHSGFTFREMAKLNKWKPFVNTEEGGRIHNWAANADSKFYTGIANQQITGCMDTSILVQYDLNCLNGVFMLEDWAGMFEPFENRVRTTTGHMTTVDEQCWQVRVAADALAGAHLMKRVPGTPPNTVAYIYRRGNDRFVGAYTSEARVGQLAEFTTTRSSLTMVDAFGNRYTMIPTAGKVRILFTNLITFVHGLAEDDTVAFIPNATNETPRILNPGTLTAVAGREFRFRVDGYDPDPSLLRWAGRHWTWSLQSPPTGMTIGTASGLIRWTPATPGTQSVTVRLTDADGASATQTFSINVLPAGSNIAPEIISQPSPVAVKGKRYIYVPRAYDPNGDTVTFAVSGPAGMTYTASSVTWTPTMTGMFNVTVTANDGNGGTATQSFAIQVQNSPERPTDGERLPRSCQYLTVTSLSGGVTLVWNKYTNCDTVVQRSASRNGPWTDIATTPNTWYRDTAPPANAFYRVVARNSAGDAEPSNVVNGRNRAPIAVAGRSTKNAGTVTLDGTGSYDPDNSGTLTYQWRVVCAPHGVNPTLTNANSATASFSGPSGLYIIELVVSDGEEVSEPDFVRVCSGASAMEPVGDLGAPRFVTAGSTTVSITAWRSGGDNTFWRLDDLPLGGYQQFQFKRQNSLTNTISNLTVPGVYLVQFVPTDQWVAGFVDFGKIIVSPPVSGDTTPPSAVNDLAAGSPTDTSIRLTWTAPGDDGTVGTAVQYDIRYSPTAITNDATFSTALQCVGEPAPQAAGSNQSFTVSGLTPGTRYWFALKTVDEAGNWSALSNVTTGQTTGTAPSVPPVVTLTSPVNGSTYTAPATVPLAATATDSDGSITRVEFWTGATLLNADTASPYAYSWTGVAAGSYALRAVAYDNTNTTSTSAIVNITVNPPPNQPPTVMLTSPVNGSTYTAPAILNLAATASDPDGSIANVRFYRGTTLLATDTASPYEYSWVNVSSGTYQLRAVAQDNQGATSTSTVVTVTVLSSSTPAVWYTLTTTVNPANGGTVSPASGTFLAGSQIQVTATPNAGYTFATWSGDITGTNPTVTLTMDGNKDVTANFSAVNSSPTVSITSPSDGATYTAPASITITATATDSDGSVAVVRFYSGATLLGADSTSPYSYTWTGVPAGSYVLTAQAQDNQGAVGVSPAIGITVSAQPVYWALTVTVNPSNGGTVAQSPTGTSHLAGTQVSLTATPNAGYEFAGWSGDITGSSTTNPMVVVMDGNKNITANFRAVQSPQPALTPGEVRIVGGLDGYINATQNPNVTIRFRRTAAGTITVRIYDLRGRLVVEKSKDGVAGIDDDIAWNATDLSAGVYIVRVNGAGLDTTKRVVVVR